METCARRGAVRGDCGIGGFGQHRDERRGQRRLAERAARERLRIDIEDMREHGVGADAALGGVEDEHAVIARDRRVA